MNKSAGSIRAHRVAAVMETQTTDRLPDFTDAFEIGTSNIDTRSSEQWMRTVFEGAPQPVRWFLLFGWRWVLGLQLGPRPSADYVLGWRIASREPDTVLLELHSTIMDAQLSLHIKDKTALWTTNVYYTHPLVRPLWAAVGLIHRQIVPYLLGRAASFQALRRAQCCK